MLWDPPGEKLVFAVALVETRAAGTGAVAWATPCGDGETAAAAAADNDPSLLVGSDREGFEMCT